MCELLTTQSLRGSHPWSQVTLTLRVILAEVLGSAVLEILQSDVMHVTTSAVNTGVATEARII